MTDVYVADLYVCDAIDRCQYNEKALRDCGHSVPHENFKFAHDCTKNANCDHLQQIKDPNYKVCCVPYHTTPDWRL